MKSPFGPAYRIETPSLVLRCWDPADAPALAALIERNREHLGERWPWARGEPKPLDEQVRELRLWRAEFDVDHAWRYAVLAVDGRELVGALSIVPRDLGATGETSGWIGREHAGRGHHVRAAAALARAVFEVHGLAKVQTACPDEEAARAAVTGTLGFRHDGMIRQLAEGRRTQQLLCTLLADEWAASPAAALAAGARAYDGMGGRLF
ncbi:MAG TPA: GNAT family protein [Longimicrobium sp.]|nr:GNAT family protein [Longimicrobium sp.]